ncbi:MAG: hypothetical protein IIC09_07940, partial [Proteobacteria bacterium]|nr:hypothetical protein [Pseudomonadota bacterium]
RWKAALPLQLHSEWSASLVMFWQTVVVCLLAGYVCAWTAPRAESFRVELWRVLLAASLPALCLGALAFSLVADRVRKTPFDPAARLHARIKRQAMDRGMICYPMGGTIDGRQGDHVLLAPPFIIDDDHIVEIIDKLDQALKATIPA